MQWKSEKSFSFSNTISFRIDSERDFRTADVFEFSPGKRAREDPISIFNVCQLLFHISKKNYAMHALHAKYNE